MARNLDTIWRILDLIKVFFGIKKLRNRRYVWPQRLWSAFLFTSVLLVYFNIIFAFYESPKFAWKIFFGLFFTTMTACNSVAVYFLMNVETYEKGLQWCEDLQARNRCHMDIFEECKRTSTKAYILFCVILPVLSGGLVAIQSLTVSILKGRISNAMMLSVPFGTQIENLLMILPQTFAAVVLALCAGATLSFLVMINVHFIALIGLKVNLLREVSPQLSRRNFDLKIKEIVNIHCELIENQIFFNNFASRQMLWFEFMAFFMCLFAWLIVFFMRKLLFIACANVANTYIYVIPCIMTELLTDSFEEFQDTIYDLEWYDMEPQQRKVLLQIMIVADPKNLLRFGPFYVVNYEAFTNLLNRVYNYGLLINAFLDPKSF